MNITLPNAAGNHESYSRTLGNGDYIFASTRFSFQVPIGWYEVRFDNAEGTRYFHVRVLPSVPSSQIAISGSTNVVFTSDGVTTPTLGTNNHTLSVYANAGGQGIYLVVYWNHDIVYEKTLGSISMSTITFNYTNEAAATSYLHLNYIAYDNSHIYTDLQDRIDELERELEELRQRQNEDDGGYIETPRQEAYIPYPTKDFMGESSRYYVDPYVTWTYTLIDEQGPGTTNSHVQTYSSSVSDYTILNDEVRWTWPGSATRIWLNQSTTELLDTTDDSYSSWDVVKNNVTLAGEALTFDTLGDSSRSVRYATVKVTQSFNWLVNPITDEHSCIVSFTNDLGIDAVRMQVYVASNPDKTIDESTVEVVDNTNAYTMEAGKNYAVMPSGFLWEIQWWNNTDVLSYSITYSPWQSGSSIVEPIGVFDYDTASNAELDNRVWLYDEVAVPNPNNFDYTNSRVTLDLREIPGSIEMIRVRDNAGTEYQLGPPLGSKYYTVLGVTIDAHGTKTLQVYVKAASPVPDVEDLQDWGLFFFTTFFILTVICGIGWIASRSQQKYYRYSDPARGWTFMFAIFTAIAFFVAFWSY